MEEISGEEDQEKREDESKHDDDSDQRKKEDLEQSKSPDKETPKKEVEPDIENVSSENLSKPKDSTDTVSEPLSQPKDSTETVSEPIDVPKLQPSSDEVDVSKQIYHVKWITSPVFNRRCPIITQNVNGPCPLLGMVNVLLLRGKMSLPAEDSEVVSSEQLLEMLADLVLSSATSSLANSASRLDLEHNMNDAIALLPKLQTGLDVNVKFSGVTHFEYTDTCVLFDLLNISLYHGWLTDPQGKEVWEAVGTLSYNQLVEKIITHKNSDQEEEARQSLLAGNFLEESASQLTYHGLCELNSAMSEDELAVFFRNNHFSTIFKHKGELFVLVSDQGFLKETEVVWETLSNIDGDGHFVDDKFLTVPPKEEAVAATAGQSGSMNLADEPLTPEQQMNRDHLLAVTLAEEDKAFDARTAEWEDYKKRKLNPSEDQQNMGEGRSMTDEELAKRLQEEEDRQAATMAAPDTQPLPNNSGTRTSPTSQVPPAVPSTSRGRGTVSASGSNRSGNKNCTIL